ncbi:hypothetical protein LCGC14_3137880, partial [marine sediment metagenome]
KVALARHAIRDVLPEVGDQATGAALGAVFQSMLDSFDFFEGMLAIIDDQKAWEALEGMWKETRQRRGLPPERPRDVTEED